MGTAALLSLFLRWMCSTHRHRHAPGWAGAAGGSQVSTRYSSVSPPENDSVRVLKVLPYRNWA